jgi:hypothetical protein
MGYRKPGTRLEKKAAHPLAVINKEEATTLDTVGSFILVHKMVLMAMKMIATPMSEQQGPLHPMLSAAPSVFRTDYWGWSNESPDKVLSTATAC